MINLVITSLIILIQGVIIMGIVPISRPQFKKEDAVKILEKYNLPQNQVYLIAFRGYYSRTFPPVGNNIGVYDDALIMISPDYYNTYNFNVDPSSEKTGRANVVSNQIIEFEIGIHNRSKAKSRQYKALIQDEATFKIYRYNQGTKYEDSIGINLHKGGYNTTSSLGCLTVYPDQWDSFIKDVEQQMNRYKQKKIQLIILDA